MKLRLLALLSLLLIILVTCRKEDEPTDNENPVTKTELADKAIVLSKTEAEEVIMTYDEVSKKMFIKAKSSYGGKMANKGYTSSKSGGTGILEVGTVLTCEPILNIPDGMLIQITEIEPYNSPTYGAGYNVGFENSQIEELIKNLVKSEDTKRLEAQTIENEGGVTSTFNSNELKFTVSKNVNIKEGVGNDTIQIIGKISGTASIEKDYKLGLEVNNHVVQYFALAVTNKDKLDLKFEGSIVGKKTKEIKLATIKGKPIVFNLGPVPVTVTPVFELKVLLEMSGKASLNLTFIKYEKEYTYGVKYNNGNWGTIDYAVPQDNSNNDFSLSLSGKLKIALEAELKGKFYGGLAYLGAFGNAYAEFSDRVNLGESAKADLALGYELGIKTGIKLWAKTLSGELSYAPIKNEYKRSVIDLLLGNPNIPTNGLVAYYPFNGNANDESGNSNHGTVNGATLTTDRHGNLNKAYSFDGINDYIEVINNEKISSLKNHFSLSFWFNSTDGKCRIIQKSGNYFSESRFKYSCDFVEEAIGLKYSHNTQNGNSYYSSGGSIYEGSAFPSSSGGWYHVAMVVSDSSSGYYGVTIYLNGKKITAGTIGALSTVFPNSNMQIGKFTTYDNWDSVWKNSFHNGSIDDIRIYNRTLSETEIQSLYNE